MYSRTTLLALFLALGLVTGLHVKLNLVKSKLKLPTNKKVHGLQQQTEVLAVRDPQTTQFCFGYYSPILSGITDQYEKNFAQCNVDYRLASDQVIRKWNSTLYDIQEAGDQGCSAFTDCSSIVDYVESFQCFASVAAEKSKILYQVSANATEAAANLKIHLQTQDTQLESCVNSAERDYVEGTITAYEDLNKCLNGGGLPSDTTPGWD